MTFGAFIKDIRIKKGLTLREFCRLTELDPSNWSKVERGLLSPPKSRAVLLHIARVLNFAENSEDWHAFFDFAAISFIPREILADNSIVEKLPVFFRTMRGEKPNRKELEDLIKLLKES
jgi:transcriptional regulator with XRE-family HTH domain